MNGAAVERPDIGEQLLAAHVDEYGECDQPDTCDCAHARALRWLNGEEP